MAFDGWRMPGNQILWRMRTKSVGMSCEQLRAGVCCCRRVRGDSSACARREFVLMRSRLIIGIRRIELDAAFYRLSAEPPRVWMTVALLDVSLLEPGVRVSWSPTQTNGL